MGLIRALPGRARVVPVAVLLIVAIAALPAAATSLKILPQVLFRRGSDVVEPPSLPILEAVAETMKGFPEVKKVAVIGHASTDDAASALDRWNLSLARSRAVVARLVASGVARERLVMQAYGSDRPIDGGQTALARDKNRRIEFLILEREDR